MSTLRSSVPPQPSGSKSTLTPQRKHRKLLKDGSGSEVWSESLECIFIEGLKKYWESPYATYSNGGRSRWRNQFLVEYLERAGISRTKKQVASHIQVLRNMWKGTPDFHLVAGAEDLLPESEQSRSLAIKMEDMCEGLITFDTDESDTLSSNSSPNFSVKSELSPLPNPPPSLTPESYSPATQLAFPSTALTYSPSSPANNDLGLPLSPPSGSISLPTTGAVHKFHPADVKSPIFQPYPLPVSQRRTQNRVTNITLLADGMAPLSYPLSGSAPLLLCIRLAMPSIDDVRSPNSLHGFRGTISLASVWSLHARCVTRLSSNGAWTAEEVVPLDISCIDLGTAIAPLPESRLTRCRWLDSTVYHMLSQEVIVDNQTLLYTIYQLERGAVLPSAQVLDCQPFSKPLLDSWTDWATSSGNGTNLSAQYTHEYQTSYALAPAIPRS